MADRQLKPASGQGIALTESGSDYLIAMAINGLPESTTAGFIPMHNGGTGLPNKISRANLLLGIIDCGAGNSFKVNGVIAIDSARAGSFSSGSFSSTLLVSGNITLSALMINSLGTMAINNGNYNLPITANYAVLTLTSDNNYTLAGTPIIAAGVDGQLLEIHQRSNFNLIFPHNTGLGGIIFKAGANKTIGLNGNFQLRYIGSNWREI